MHVGGIARDQVEIDEQPRAGGPGTAGSRLVVPLRQRVVEIVRAHFQPKAAAAQLGPPLELVEGHVDAVLEKQLQRGLEPLAPNLLADVARRDARMPQQAAVGVLLVQGDDAFDHADERLFARGEPLARQGQTSLAGQWRAQERSQPFRQ